MSTGHEGAIPYIIFYKEFLFLVQAVFCASLVYGKCSFEAAETGGALRGLYEFAFEEDFKS